MPSTDLFHAVQIAAITRYVNIADAFRTALLRMVCHVKILTFQGKEQK
jgi:hypothetical protein